jgi:hypothetical protein
MMKRSFPTILLIFVAVFTACQSGGNNAASSSPTSSASPSASYDPAWTDLNRVKPGALAPDFALPDESGKTHRLSDYRGRKHVVLVFYRGFF